jgi:hypothetical protein
MKNPAFDQYQSSKTIRIALLHRSLRGCQRNSLWPLVSILCVPPQYSRFQVGGIVVGIGGVFRCFHQSRNLRDLSLMGQSDMDLTFFIFEDAGIRLRCVGGISLVWCRMMEAPSGSHCWQKLGSYCSEAAWSKIAVNISCAVYDMSFESIMKSWLSHHDSF